MRSTPVVAVHPKGGRQREDGCAAALARRLPLDRAPALHAAASFVLFKTPFAHVPRLVPVLIAVCALLLSACQTTRPPVPSPHPDRLRQQVDSLQAVTDSLSRAAFLRNPLLLSTLWVQTAVEYDGTARQAYVLAEQMMRRGLADSTWTASTEQAEMGHQEYRDKPPAVVLDVDETVLDNSPYQARLIREDEAYGSESWGAWVRERQADPLPGARAFTQAAVQAGVQVIYLTNRDADLEGATRDNLRAFGFPVDDAPDAVLTQGEQPGWEVKRPRRAWVAERYRILLLVGDNFGDFAAEVDTTVAARRQRGRAFREYWGTRWIVLPNPQYGSWEGALHEFAYGRPRLQQLDAMHQQLRPKASE